MIRKARRPSPLRSPRSRSSCSRARRRPVHENTFVMGTKAWVTIAGMPKSDAERAADAAFRDMYRIESVMSNWRSTSEISRLNAGSNGVPFTVSRELYSIIDSSLFYSKATSGAFDVTVRPLVLLWGFEGGTAKLPTDEEVARARSLVGYQKVVLDSARSTVTLPPGMQIDLAGVAKGYALDRCVAVIKKLGARNALVNLGGNIYALGAPPGEAGWTIGIRDPKGGLGTVGSLLLRDQAVATSGNYENFVELDGKRYGHLIDPRTGRPVSAVLSVTVVSPTGLSSDALSSSSSSGRTRLARPSPGSRASPRCSPCPPETVSNTGRRGISTLDCNSRMRCRRK